MRVIFKTKHDEVECYVDLAVGWNENENKINRQEKSTLYLLNKKMEEMHYIKYCNCSRMSQSVSDNRKVYLSVPQIGEFALIFSSVFRKHQFLALFKLG